MESSQAGAPGEEQSSPAGVQSPGEEQPTQPVGDAPAEAPSQDDAPSEAASADHADTSVSGATAPAGAVQPDAESGVLRQHGEVTPGLGQAPSEFPDAGTAREVAGVSEPDQVEVDRPDIGTPVEGSGGE